MYFKYIFDSEEFYTDDRGTARVNSGEAVLTAAQQRNFMALANGKRGGSGTQTNVTNNAIHEAEAFIGGKI